MIKDGEIDEEEDLDYYGSSVVKMDGELYYDPDKGSKEEIKAQWTKLRGPGTVATMKTEQGEAKVSLSRRCKCTDLKGDRAPMKLGQCGPEHAKFPSREFVACLKGKAPPVGDGCGMFQWTNEAIYQPSLGQYYKAWENVLDNYTRIRKSGHIPEYVEKNLATTILFLKARQADLEVAAKNSKYLKDSAKK